MMPASYTNGRTKYIKFEQDYPGTVSATFLGTPIVMWLPSNKVSVRTGGHVTPSTFDAIAKALDIERGGSWCGTVQRNPYVLGRRMTEGMVFDGNTGKLLTEGSTYTPLAPARKRRVNA